MKKSILEKKAIPEYIILLIVRLVCMIPWPLNRQAMADVTITLLDSKPRLAESVFGWSRATVSLGMNELRTGLICKNDLSTRHKPKTEEKYPQLVEDINKIMEPMSHADPGLRTTLSYTNLSASAVKAALIEMGWSIDILPGIRTISEILNRQGYRLRTVAKSKVKKNKRY
jgi:hypothetical protein